MRHSLHSLPSMPLAGVALAAVLMAPLPTASHALDRPAIQGAVQGKAGMVIHVQTSGGYRYTGTLTHAEDTRDTIPAQYSCVRFTHPNFASRAKPLAYNVSFNNPGVMAATGGLFFAFYYNPKIAGYQRVDGETGVNLAVVPAQYKSFAPGGEGTYKVMVKLSPDGHSGAFTATNFRNIVGGESHATSREAGPVPRCSSGQRRPSTVSLRHTASLNDSTVVICVST